MSKMVLMNLTRDTVKTALSSVLMKSASALMLPTGHLSPDNAKSGGAQAQLAREQRDSSAQDRKRKSPTKPAEEWNVQHDKKMNDAHSILGQMAKAQEKAQENLGYYPTGNFSGGGRGGRNRGGRGGPRTPFNNRQGQDNSKEIVNGKPLSSKHHKQPTKNPSVGTNQAKI
jgi:hypothetical protein